MKYDFDRVVDRYGTNSLKYDFKSKRGMPEDVIPLWVADMDFRVSDEVTNSLEKLVQHGIYGYSEINESYFKALSEWMKKYHDWEVKREWLVKTPGVVFAIAMAVRALTNVGDAIIIQSPVYYPFFDIVEINDRKLVNSQLCEKDGKYFIDYKDFEEKIVENNVKLFILCSPHNPVGRVWKKEELLKLGDICLRNGVYVVSDEIHEDFVYGDNKHTVFSNLSQEIQDITITCTAPSKTFNLAGLQVSNIFIPNRDIRKKFKREIAKSGYSQLNIAGLTACESAYRGGREWLDDALNYIEDNLNYIREFLSERLPKIRIIEPEGTYLLWLDCRDIGLSPEELEDIIVNKAKLWLDAGTIFGENGKGFQRINLACPKEILEKAMENLEKALASID